LPGAQRQAARAVARAGTLTILSALFLLAVCLGLSYLALDTPDGARNVVERATAPQNATLAYSVEQTEVAAEDQIVGPAAIRATKMDGQGSALQDRRSARDLPSRRVRRSSALPRTQALEGKRRQKPDRAMASDDGIEDLDLDSELRRSLSATDLAVVHRQNAPVLRGCHRRALRQDPLLRVGKAQADLKVTPEGKVESVRFPNLQEAALEQCLHRAIAAWRFPPSEEGATTQLTLLFAGR